MKQHPIVLSLFAAGALFIGACEGSSTSATTAAGVAPVRVGATLSASSAVDSAPAYAPLHKRVEFGADITLTSIKVVAGNIALRLQGGDDGRDYDDDFTTAASDHGKGRKDDGEKSQDRSHDGRHHAAYDFAGPYLFDLTTQTVTPSMAPVSLPTGIYKHVELSFHAATTADAAAMGLDVSDPVVGNSYVIEGWLNGVDAPGVPTGSSVKLVIFGSQEKTYKVNLKHGVAVTEGALNDLLLVFDADGWFPSSLVGQLRSGLNVGSVTVDSSGPAPVVYLDANRNSSLAAQFNKLFHDGVLLVKDVDGDGEAGKNETPEQVGGE